jgi:hypothetical protein
MRKHSTAKILIEWLDCAIAPSGAGSSPPQERLLEIARALGRLAARGDLARLKQGDRLSSDAKSGIVAMKEPV